MQHLWQLLRHDIELSEFVNLISCNVSNQSITKINILNVKDMNKKISSNCCVRHFRIPSNFSISKYAILLFYRMCMFKFKVLVILILWTQQSGSWPTHAKSSAVIYQIITIILWFFHCNVLFFSTVFVTIFFLFSI